MTYLNAKKYIGAAREGVSADDTLVRLLALVGNPQNRIKYVRLAGSNGKTVCSEMLSAVLENAGIKSGSLRMPIASELRENICIGTNSVSMSDFADCTATIKQRIIEHSKENADTEEPFLPIEPTRSEILLAVALMCFVKHHCEVAVIESDHCGKDPSVALPHPFAAVICGTIPSTDAEQISRIRSYIGKGIEEIVSAPQDSEAYKIISDTCYAAGCRLTLPNRADVHVQRISFGGCRFTYKGGEYCISLCGRFQVHNAVLTLEVIEMLVRKGFKISEENIRCGLASLRIPAKLEVISIKPVMIIDSTHTPEAVETVLDSLVELVDKSLTRVRLCVPSGELARTYVSALEKRGFLMERIVCPNDAVFEDGGLNFCACKTHKAMAKKCTEQILGDVLLMVSGEYPFAASLRYEILSLMGY